MMTLKELRHSQFFHCWVLLINSKDQNATFHGVLMAVFVLKPTHLYNSALELEQSWLYPHSIQGTAGPCSEECLHPREGHNTLPEQGITCDLSTKKATAEGRKSVSRGLQPPRGCVRAQQERPGTGNKSGTPGRGWKMSWSCLGMTRHMNAIPFYHKMD